MAAGALLASCEVPEDDPCPAPDEVLDADTDACVPAACGSGEWGEIERDGGALHVSATRGDDDGDGSADRPYRSLQAALDDLDGADGRVVLAAGEYDVSIVRGDGVALEIEGRCRDFVTLHAEDPAEPAIALGAGSLLLKGVTLVGGRRGVLLESPPFGARVSGRVEAVTLRDNAQFGLSLSGADVDLRDVIVEGTTPNAAGNGGTGVAIWQGARVDARDLVVRGAALRGVWVHQGGEAEVTRLRVMDAAPTARIGVEVADGGALTGADVRVEAGHGIGLYAGGSDTTVAVEGLTIRDVAPTEGLADGFGAGVVVDEAIVELADFVVEDVAVDGIRMFAGDLNLRSGRVARAFPGVHASGGALTARDLQLEDLIDAGLRVEGRAAVLDWVGGTVTGVAQHPDPEEGGGHGVDINAGAEAEIEGVAVSGHASRGVLVRNDAVAALLDVSVTGGDYGVQIAYGAAATIDGLVAIGPERRGLYVRDADAVVSGAELRGATVDGPDDEDAFGAVVSEGGTLDATDLVVEDNEGRGIEVKTGSSLVLRRSLLRGNGEACLASFGGTVEVEDVECVGGVGLGVGILTDSVGELVDLVIRDTAGAANSGIGLQVSASRLTSRGLVVENTEGVAVGVIVGSTVEFVDTSIRGWHVGAGPSSGMAGFVVQESTARVDGLEMVGGREGAIAATLGASLELSSAVVRELDAAEGGTAVAAQRGGLLVGRDLEVEDFQGVAFSSLDGVLDLAGITARGGRVGDSLVGGRGVVLWGESLGSVLRDVLVEDVTDAGLLLGGGAAAEVHGLAIRGVSSSPGYNSGAGVQVQTGSTLEISDLQVSDTASFGLSALNQAVVEMSDFELSGTRLGGVGVSESTVRLDDGVIADVGLHATYGGGVGLLRIPGGEEPVDIEVSDVSFSRLLGPALYLRGPGRYVLSRSTVSDSSTWPLPGGILATDGVTPWDPVADSGLLVRGNTFTDLAGDAILLDESGGTLTADPETGPNRFEGIGAEPLYRQRCGGAPDAVVDDGSAADPACREGPRPLGPLLDYFPWIADGSAAG